MIRYSRPPKELWEDLEYEINRNNLECADNYRAYRYADKLFFEGFMESHNRGCCGFFLSHTHIEGEKWIIGCNYGH